MFTGTYTALVTPFRKGKVDEAALRDLVAWQIKEGVDGLVPVGTTGESPTVDCKEHIRIIEVVVEAAKGKAKVMAGTGANSTAEAVELTREAEDVGADASLQVSPYYNKPTQEGLYLHYRAIAEATELPIMLYSIPGRCGIEIGVDTCRRLSKDCPNIIGIKEAGGTPERVSLLRSVLPPSFTIMCGDDSMTLPFMSVGAEGVISVASNVVPREVVHMVKAFAQGKTTAALKLHAKLYPIFKNLFIETNPIPVKAALAMMGKIEEEYRLPMCRISAANHEVVKKTLQDLGII